MTKLLQKQRGFTLIEILISLVILSMLVTLAGSAYSIYIDRWKDNLGDFQQQLNETRGTMLVDQALQNVFPFVVENSEETQRESNELGLFFFGDENRLEAIVGSGVFNYANAAIFKLIKDDDKLVYFERSTADVLLLKANQEFTYNRKLTYTDNIESVSFRYYGWPSYQQKLDYLSGNATTDSRQWFTRYYGPERGLLPERIELTVQTEDHQWQLVYPVADGSDNIMGKYFND